MSKTRVCRISWKDKFFVFLYWLLSVNNCFAWHQMIEGWNMQYPKANLKGLLIYGRTEFKK